MKQDIKAAQSERDKAVEEYNKISAKYDELQNAQEASDTGKCKRDTKTS